MNDILKPFGPSIGKYKLSDDDINKLLKITDKLSENYDKEIEVSRKLVGRIHEQLYYTDDTFVDYFISKMEKYVFDVYNYQGMLANRKYDGKPKIDIKVMWLNNQVENEYNPAHIHPDGSHLTSVLYLKVPDKMTDKFPDGKLHIINNSQCSYNSGNLELTDYFVSPEVGDFYIFPSYLKHAAYPFKGEGVRRSLVINSSIG